MLNSSTHSEGCACPACCNLNDSAAYTAPIDDRDLPLADAYTGDPSSLAVSADMSSMEFSDLYDWRNYLTNDAHDLANVAHDAGDNRYSIRWMGESLSTWGQNAKFNLTDTGEAATGGTVTYYLGPLPQDPTGFTDELAYQVVREIKQYAETFGINLVETTDRENANVLVTDVPNDGGYVIRTKDANGGKTNVQMQMVIGEVFGSDRYEDRYGTQVPGTILHEISHFWGFGHVRLNPETGEYIASETTLVREGGLPAASIDVITLYGMDYIHFEDGYSTANSQEGDTVWGFNTNVPADTMDLAANWATTHYDYAGLIITDGGGQDVLDLSGFSNSSLIDMRPTDADATFVSYSNVGGRTGNLIMSVGTVIEDLKAGSGSEKIFGNHVNNTIDAGWGSDLIYAMGGDDTILVDGLNPVRPGTVDDVIEFNIRRTDDGLVQSDKVQYTYAEGARWAPADRFTVEFTFSTEITLTYGNVLPLFQFYDRDLNKEIVAVVDPDGVTLRVGDAQTRFGLPTNLADGQKHTVALTVDGAAGTARLFIDGAERGNNGFTPDTNFSGNTALFFGGDGKGFLYEGVSWRNGDFEGEVYGMRLYSDIRSDAEIAASAFQPKADPGDDALFGNWLPDLNANSIRDTVTGQVSEKVGAPAQFGNAGSDDTVYGGTGIDTVVFARNYGDYDISATADGGIELRDGTGTDYIAADVEIFRFADRTLARADVVPVTPPPTFEGQFTAEYFAIAPGASRLADINFRVTPVLAEGIDAVQYQASLGSFWADGPSDNFAARITGEIDVIQSGRYTFYLTSDDGSRLIINGEEVLLNDGIHAMVEQSVSLDLTAGIAEIEIQYFENGGFAGLVLDWEGPGTGGRTAVTASTGEAPVDPVDPVDPTLPSQIINGDFEDLSAGVGANTTPNGWVTTGEASGVFRSGAERSDGHAYALGGWSGQGGQTLEQTVATVAGTRYTLDFDAGGAYGSFSGALVVIAASAAGDQELARIGSDALGNLAARSVSFVANAAETNIRFVFDGTGGGDIDIDNVALRGGDPVVPPPTGEELIVNGDFEDTSGGVGPSTTPAGWETTGPVSGVFAANADRGDGYAYALGGWSREGGQTLAQSVTTVAGQSYVLNFDAGAYSNFTGSLKVIARSASGDQELTSLSQSELGNTSAPRSVTFTANNSATDIVFVFDGTGRGDIDIDNVSMKAVGGGTGGETAGLFDAMFFAADGAQSLADVNFSQPQIADAELATIQFQSSGGSFWDGGRTDNFAAKIAGTVDVPQAGTYTFFLTSDDGSRLLVNGQEVIANDGLHAMVEKTGTITLGAGPATIEVEYFEAGGNAGLHLDWDGPGTGGRTAVTAADGSGPLAADGALNYQFFDGETAGYTVDNIPLSGGTTGTATDFDVSALANSLTGSTDTYAVRYSGRIQVEDAGQFVFRTYSDDGSALFIDGQKVVDNDGLHAMQSAGGEVNLGTGFHDIEVVFFEHFGSDNLRVTVAGPETGGQEKDLFASDLDLFL